MRCTRLTTCQRRVDELAKQRMWTVGTTLELGVGLCTDPERMVVELDELDQSTIGRETTAAQAGGFELRLELGVQLPAMSVTFADHGLAIGPVHAGVRLEDRV